jgi:hypothetical protein
MSLLFNKQRKVLDMHKNIPSSRASSPSDMSSSSEQMFNTFTSISVTARGQKYFKNLISADMI